MPNTIALAIECQEHARADVVRRAQIHAATPIARKHAPAIPCVTASSRVVAWGRRQIIVTDIVEEPPIREGFQSKNRTPIPKCLGESHDG